jgi:hypothetical protein
MPLLRLRKGVLVSRCRSEFYTIAACANAIGNPPALDVQAPIRSCWGGAAGDVANRFVKF